MFKCQQDIWLPLKQMKYFSCDWIQKTELKEDITTLQKHAFGGFEGIRNARPPSKGAHTDTGGSYSHDSTASASIIHALLSRFNPAQTAHLTSYAFIHSSAYSNTKCVLPSGEDTYLNALSWALFQLLCLIRCIRCESDSEHSCCCDMWDQDFDLFAY